MAVAGLFVAPVTSGASIHAAAAPPPCTGTYFDPDFPCEAEVPFKKSNGAPAVPGTLTLVPGLGRIAAWGHSSPTTIEQFDIRQGAAPVQLTSQSVPLPWIPYLGALDPGRNRFFLSEFAVSGANKQFQLVAKSLTGEFAGNGTYTFPPLFEGGMPKAMTYDARRGILYVVTVGFEQVPATAQELGTSATSGVPRTHLHAIDPQALIDSPADDSAVRLWSYEVSACNDLAGAAGRVAGLAVTPDGTSMAFACRAQSDDESGQNEFRVITIGQNPRTANPAGFTEERIPIVAALKSNPMSFVDHARGRIILVAAAGVSRVYVFDVAKRAFIGARPLGDLNIFGLALDELRGRVYPVQETRELFLVDTDQVPSSQGRPVDFAAKKYQAPGLGGGFTTGTFDPVSRRLYVQGNFIPCTETDCPGTSGVTAVIRVYRDRTPPPTPPVVSDPDAGTHDIDESQAVSVSYTGSGAASGARYQWVGGVGESRLGAFTSAVASILDPLQAPDVRPGTGKRELTFGYVEQAELRDNGATAGAVGARYGPTEQQDFAERSPGCRTLNGRSVTVDIREITPADECRNTVRGNPTSTTAPPPDDVPTLDAMLKSEGSPFHSTECALRGGDPVTVESSGSAVTCDPLPDDEDSAEAVHASATAAGDLPESAPSEPDLQFTVGSAKAFSDVVRTSKGIEVRSTALARGIKIAVPGLGSFRLGEVRSVATANANGRVGKAASTLKVFYDNAVMTGPSGEVEYACGARFTVGSDIQRKNHQDGDCDPGELVRQFNEHFSRHIRMLPPRRDTRSEVMGSDGGAQAIVLKDQYQYWNDFNLHADDRWEVSGLEFIIHHEPAGSGSGAQPKVSRQIVQLANVFAEAQYRIGQARGSGEGGGGYEPPTNDEEGPANLAISLANLQGQPLAGGTFEVRSTRSAVPTRGDVTICTTAADGIGDCDLDLPAGPYVVRQLGAPVGYESATESVPMTLLAEVRTEVAFTNARERAVVLGTTAGGGQPTYIFEGDGSPMPIVNVTGPTSDGKSPLAILTGLPGEILDYLIRNPAQAVMIGLVWMLLGTPAYLALRRRDLLHTRTSI